MDKVSTVECEMNKGRVMKCKVINTTYGYTFDVNSINRVGNKIMITVLASSNKDAIDRAISFLTNLKKEEI